MVIDFDFIIVFITAILFPRLKTFCGWNPTTVITAIVNSFVMVMDV